MSGDSAGGRRVSLWAAYVVCGSLVAASAGVIVWRSRSGSDGNGEPARPAAIRGLLSRPIATSAGGAVRLSQVQADFVVLYLFTPLDCAACLPELARLDAFAAQRPEFRVLAIMGHSNVAEAEQTRQNFDLGVQILQDPDGEIIRSLAPPKTPWKVVLEMPAGKVVLQEVGAEETFGAEAFLRQLRELADS